MLSDDPTTRERLTYGPDARQHVDLIGRPTAGRCVLFVHGGFWRQEKDSASLWPAVQALHTQEPDFALVGTIGYRTADTGGVWPVCRDDVVAAVRAVWAAGAHPADTMLVGHSAGGQLALTAALELIGLGVVVGLAAVSDLQAAAADRLGDDAVGLLFGGVPDPTRVRQASPVCLPAPRCRVELVHGDADQAVPAEYSERLYAAWRERGDVQLTIVPDARHMHLVNPERAAWTTVAQRVVAAGGAPA